MLGSEHFAEGGLCRVTHDVGGCVRCPCHGAHAGRAGVSPGQLASSPAPRGRPLPSLWGSLVWECLSGRISGLESGVVV